MTRQMVYQIETTSPPGPADLDLLTPYGTLFRYEDIPAEVGLDRKAAFEIITTLRELVEQKLGVR